MNVEPTEDDIDILLKAYTSFINAQAVKDAYDNDCYFIGIKCDEVLSDFEKRSSYFNGTKMIMNMRYPNYDFIFSGGVMGGNPASVKVVKLTLAGN